MYNLSVRLSRLCVRLCVCVYSLAIVSKVEERVVFGKKKEIAVFDRSAGIYWNWWLCVHKWVRSCVCVCVCVLVCEDTALAYNNTFHYRSVSVLREWVCSLSLRQRQWSRKLPLALWLAPNATAMLLCFFQLNIINFLPHTNCHLSVTYTDRDVELRSRTHCLCVCIT